MEGQRKGGHAPGRTNMTEENSEKKETKSRYEEFKLSGGEILNKMKELIHEGNIRRVTLKDETGKTFLEIPLTVGLVGAAFAPVLAAVGAIAALVSKMTIVVEKVVPDQDSLKH
jgi:hypothetical protein